MQLLGGIATLLGYLVWRLLVAATAVFVGRLLWTGLWRVYPALTAYFVADLIQQCLRLALPVYTVEVYLVGNGLKIPLVAAALWELTRAGFAQHPALARFSRRASWNLMGACIVVAAINLFLDPAVPPDRSPLLHYFIVMERAVTTGLLLFVVILGLFMSWFPVPMRRNVAWFLAGLCLIFAANWVSLLVSNLSPGQSTPVSALVGDGVSLVCLTCWAVATEPAGEATTTVTARLWNEAEMTRLSGQLDAIHERLVRLNQ